MQQQIENVVLKASEMEELLARAKQAGDMEEVKYLRNQPAGAAVQVKGQSAGDGEFSLASSARR